MINVKQQQSTLKQPFICYPQQKKKTSSILPGSLTKHNNVNKIEMSNSKIGEVPIITFNQINSTTGVEKMSSNYETRMKSQQEQPKQNVEVTEYGKYASPTQRLTPSKRQNSIDSQLKTSISLNQLIQKSKQNTKKSLQESSANLRQRIWVCAQLMFRKITEYGEQYYQQLLSTVNMNSPKQDDEGCNYIEDKVVTDCLAQSLKNTCNFYNQSIMKRLIQEIEQEFSKQLQQTLQLHISQLFYIPSNITKQISNPHQQQYVNSSKNNPIKENCSEIQRGVAPDNQSYKQLKFRNKSSSLNKPRFNSQNKHDDYDETKEKQFQEIYLKINEARQKNSKDANQMYSIQDRANLNSMNAQQGSMYRNQNPYGLNTFYSAQNNRQSSNQVNSSINSSHNHSRAHSQSKMSPNTMSRNYNRVSNMNMNSAHNYGKIQQSYLSHGNRNSKFGSHRKQNKYKQLPQSITALPFIQMINNPINPFNSSHAQIFIRNQPVSFVQNKPNDGQFIPDAISAIGSRERLNHSRSRSINREQKVPYIVDQNQKAITCQWLEQIAISSDVKNFSISPGDDFSRQSINSSNIPNFNSGRGQQDTHSNQSQDNKVVCLTFCNNFKDLAIGCRNANIYIYQITQQNERHPKLVTKLIGQKSSVCCLYNHNGILFSGSDIGCCSIYLWNTASWTIRSKITYHSAAVCNIVGIPNTDYILSSSFDRTIKLYNYQKSVISSNYQSNLLFFTRLIYYQRLQKLVGITPGNVVSVLKIDMEHDQYKLNYIKDIICPDKVTTAEKAATKDKNMVVLGYQSGLIQLFSMQQLTKIKKIQLMEGPLLNINTFSRSSKGEHPIIVCICAGSKVLYNINTQTQHISKCNIKGNLDIVVGQGVGSLMVVNQKFGLFWVDQVHPERRIFFTKFGVY